MIQNTTFPQIAEFKCREIYAPQQSREISYNKVHSNLSHCRSLNLTLLKRGDSNYVML